MADDLTARLHLGDTAALEEAIDRYGAYAAKIIAAFLNQKLPAQDMEEVLSDVFTALWNNRGKLGDVRELKPYLAAVARNAARSRLRRLHPTQELPEGDVLADGAPAPEALLETEERIAAVRAALDTLGREDQRLFYRFYFLEQTVAEISLVTGCNPSTLKSRLKRGREKLRRTLLERGITYAER